ncbi:SMC-Scp complex subunit ScpB [Dermatophilus congolensis]|uniref:SMC-Scp complex subunit ScpB n=1 Tax=Dermatophilus congolensis TaxID=1863 RepID=UPI00312C89CA
MNVEAVEGVGGKDVEGEDFGVDELPGGLKAALEAVVMVVEEPVTVEQLSSALSVSSQRVEATLEELRDEYDSQGRGFSLRCTEIGWRIYSRAELGPAVEKFVLEGARARLTKAALETLAIIAYRQPVSRARISAVRGVNVDGVVRTLLSKGLITEMGLDPEHGAVLYGTTPYFLDRLGVGSLDDLPPLAPYLPEVEEVTDRLDVALDVESAADR